MNPPKAPIAVLHLLHYTGCCQETHHACQGQMRRAFQGRLLQCIPRLRLITAYCLQDLLHNITNERNPIDLLALSVGCDGEIITRRDMKQIRRHFDGPILIWGTEVAIRDYNGMPGVECLKKVEGERPIKFFERTLDLLATGPAA